MKKSVLTLFLLFLLCLSLLVSCVVTPPDGGNSSDEGKTPPADDGTPPADDGGSSSDEGGEGAPIVPSEDILKGTPTLDGALDKKYEYSYRLTVSGEEDTFHTSKGGTKNGSYGDSATAYYLYDEGHLYVCIVVKDDAVCTRGEAWAIANIAALSWENDAVEARLYYEELGEAKQANQYIFQCDAYAYATTNYLSMCQEPYMVKTAITEDGFTVEFALPLSFGKTAGDKIGLAIEIDDLHENVDPADTAMGTHDFNAYGSQHPYLNMVALSALSAP